MCDPITIATAVTAFTAISGAKQAYDQGKYEKGVSRYNARILENQAQETRNQGVEAENTQRQRVAQLVSKQRAQLAANGVVLDSGSALQMQEDTMVLGEADALRIRSNYDNEVTSLKNKAILTKSQGDMAFAAGKFAAVGSLLKGAGSMTGSGVSDKWFTPQSAANTTLNLNGNNALNYISTVA